MTPLEWILLASTIVGILITTGTTTYSKTLETLNSDVSNEVKHFSKAITEQIKNKRIDINKLLSAAQSKNAQALQGILMSNPVLANLAKRIYKNDTLLAEISSEYNSLEQTLNDLRSELSSQGYSQSHGEAWKAKARTEELKRDVKKVEGDMDNLLGKANSALKTSDALSKPNTSHLDAVTQNIKGGLNT